MHDIRQYRFYEKVLNVKADVAAILNSFFPAAVVSDPAIGSRQRPFHRYQEFARTADALTVEDQLFEIARSTHSCRASIRTLNEPLWARCMLRSDFKPGPPLR